MADECTSIFQVKNILLYFGECKVEGHNYFVMSLCNEQENITFFLMRKLV